MSILNQILQSIQSVLTTAARIFSPTDDNYPATGVQPFKGKQYNKKAARSEER